LQLAPVLLTLLIVAPYVGAVPVWDSLRLWETCIKPGAAAPSALFHSGCWGYPSFTYLAPAVLIQILKPGSITLLSTLNVLLSLAAVAAFGRLLATAMPGAERARERLCLGLAMAAGPVLVAAAPSIGLSTGTLAFATAVTAALAEKRSGLAATLGVPLVFTEAAGATFYVLAACAYISTRRNLTLRGVWDLAITLLFPVAVLAFYFAYGWSGPRAGLAYLSDLASGLADVRLLREDCVRAVAAVLLFNSGWLPAAVAVAAGALWYIRGGAGKRGAPGAPGALLSAPPQVFLVLTLGAAVFAASRAMEFLTPPRVLFTWPLLLVTAGMALPLLLPQPRVRAALLAAYVGLTVIGCFRTVDPLPRLVFGTFRAGAHSLLKPTSLLGECCGMGRDQLAYNLEFLGIGAAVDQALAAVRPTAETVITLPDAGAWYLADGVDPVTFARQLPTDASLIPHFLTPTQLLALVDKPAEPYMLELPFVDSTAAISMVERQYYYEQPGNPPSEAGFGVRIHHLFLVQRAVSGGI
jgi:hypothetical protein